MSELQPPYSERHERSLLSCCLWEPLDCGRTALDTFGDECPFHLPECALIWGAFQRIDLDKISIITVSDYLGNRLPLTTIREIAKEAPSIAQFNLHLDWVRKHHVQRKMIHSLHCAQLALYDPKAEVDAVSQEVIAQVNGTITEGHKGVPMGEAMEEFERWVRSDNNGTSSGYHRLDRVVAPIPWESLVIIAARAKIGKSALSMGMCINLAIQGHKPVYYSLEMPRNQLLLRAVASAACISSRVSDMRMAADTERFATASDAMKRLDIQIEDSIFDWNKIKRDIRVKIAAGATHIFIDHAGLINVKLGGNGNREREIATITGEAKRLAMEFKRPIFILFQLNRLAEGVMPRLSHLRESGAAEQDADIVILLHRDRVEGDHEKFMHIRSGGHVDVTALVAANRHGEEGPVQMRFFPKFSLYSNDQ